MADKPLPDIAVLRQLLHYDPDTGEIRWATGFRTGRLAGGIDELGYIRLGFAGTRARGHQVAWALHYGHWPNHEVDHRDRNRANNRIKNLRKATHIENLMNCGARRRFRDGSKHSQYKGVTYAAKDRRWRAQIGVAGRNLYLGNHLTEEAAARAYDAAALHHYGEFAHTNFGEDQ